MLTVIGFITILVIGDSCLSAQLLTLDEAVGLALAHNRDIASARLEPLKISEQRAALRSRRLPAADLFVLGSQTLNPLNFTFSEGLLGVYAGTGPIPATDVPVKTGPAFTGFYVARLVQPISPLLRIRQNVRLLDISFEVAREQTRVQEQEVTSNVSKLYYSLQQAVSSIRASEEAVALNRELVRQTDEYLAREAVLKSDQLKVRLNLARAEQSANTLKNQQANAKEQLNQLLGRDPLTEFTVAPLVEITDLEEDPVNARKAAVSNRPEVRQAHLKVKLAEQDIVVKKTEYIPQFNAEFDSLGLANFNRFLPAELSMVGVSLTWDVFDWGRKKHEIAEKEYTAAQARNAAAEADSSAVVAVDDRLRQLRASRDHVRVASLAREAAAENLRELKVRFQIEASLVKDVLQAQAGLEQANAEEAQAAVEFWSAKADFERATGVRQ